jgi:hypothetical protein
MRAHRIKHLPALRLPVETRCRQRRYVPTPNTGTQPECVSRGGDDGRPARDAKLLLCSADPPRELDVWVGRDLTRLRRADVRGGEEEWGLDRSGTLIGGEEAPEDERANLRDWGASVGVGVDSGELENWRKVLLNICS